MPKLGPNSPCPCGSGKKFKLCCHGKAFSFLAEDVDSYTVRMPMTGSMQEIAVRSADEFRRHFEREPGPRDPFFLAKYLYSERDTEREIVAAMKAVDVNPAIIYAYKKTGYILSKSQLHRYTGAAIAEWDEAIEEFDEHEGEPDEGPEAQLFDATLASLAVEFESLIYTLGLANDNYFNNPELVSATSRQESILTATQYQALCASRVHRTLRTIRVLVEQQLSEDILKLARSIYESYLHMVAVQCIPSAMETFVDAVVGLRNGTHQYKKRSDGSDDKRFITELASGREILSQISNFRMAEASPYLEDIPFFDFFYTTTSQLIHPTVFALDAYVSSNGLDPIKPHMDEEAIVFTACVATMVVDWIPLMEGCPSQVAIDCRTVVKRIRKKLFSLLELLEVWTKRMGANPKELSIIKARCNRLAEG